MAKSSLLTWIPGMRWTPHDINNGEGSEKAHRVRFTIPDRRAISSSSANSKSSNSRSDDNTLTNSTSSEHNVDKSLLFPTLRRKSSALSVMDERGRRGVRTRDQLQSPFFAKMPLEIRIMVYEFVAGQGETVHFTLGGRKRRYGHFVCAKERPEGEMERGEGLRAEKMEKCGCKILVGGGKMSTKVDEGLVSLLRSCRRIYSEAIPYLYIPHTFSLLHPAHLLCLPSRIPMPRLNTIRTLRVCWILRGLPYLRRPVSAKRYAYPEDTAHWEQGWNILASMEGLRDLYVTISDHPTKPIWETRWLELEEKLLEPVKRVTSPKKFVVVLPYESCGVEWDMGECCVVLRRPGLVG